MAQRVLIVDDHLLLAELLADAARDAGLDPEVLDPATMGDRSILGVVAELGPAVVVLDLRLGRARSGLDLIASIVARGSTVAVLTASQERAEHAAAIRAGAAVVLDKLTRPSELLRTVAVLAAGGDASVEAGRELLPLALEDDPQLVRFLRLTRREREVLDGLIRGLSAKQIAFDLGVTVATVRTQVQSVYRKLEVHNQREAVALAVGSRWGSPSP